MYYEEQVIDGQLCYRNAPDAPWAVLEYHYVVTRLLRAEKKVNTFDQAREALQEAIIMIFNEKCSHQGECGPGKDYCYAIKQAEALSAMEATS